MALNQGGGREVSTGHRLFPQLHGDVTAKGRDFRAEVSIRKVGLL